MDVAEMRMSGRITGLISRAKIGTVRVGQLNKKLWETDYLWA